MAGYIGNKSSVVSSGAERKFKFTITETTTTLSNLAYTPNLVHVFHNGVRLVDGTDYTATNGTSITLTNAAENGDEVVVISYASFQPSDTVSASLGGTFEGNVTVNADLTVSGNTDINGGTIDGTVIGGSTPAAISGTTGTFSGNLTVDTNTLFVDSANNRVGVGTTSPASLLDIANPSGFSNRVIHVTGDINPTGYDASTSGARVGFTYGTAEVAGIRSGVTNGTGGAETSRLVFSTANSGVLSQKLCIEANGNVGIGTSSPATKLQVAGSLSVQGGDNSIQTRGGNDWLMISSNQGYGTPGMHLKLDKTDGGRAMFITNTTERMRIDEAGRVTTPFQPAFHAYGNSLGSTVFNAGDTVPFPNARYNVGNHYNTSTSTFTAPVTGIYHIWFVAFNNSSTANRVQLVLNGSAIFGQGSATSYVDFHQSVTAYMVAGDSIKVNVTYNNTTIYQAANHTEFGGCLLG